MNSIISALMSFMLPTTLFQLPCAVGNHMDSLVIMILGIHRMPLGSLDSGMPRRRSLCEFSLVP
jgi:hypothetical protein